MCEPSGHRASALLFALLVGALLPAPAEAGEDASAKAERLKKEGFRQFAAGDYGAAVDAMERAYIAVPHPDLLFNIAAIYDRWGGHCDEALGALRRFFAVCDACSTRAAAEKKQQEIEARCGPRRSEPERPPTNEGVHAQDTSDIPSRTPASEDAQSSVRPADTGRSGSLGHGDRGGTAALTASSPPAVRRTSVLERVGWVSVGIGVAAVATGTLFTIETLGDVRAADDARASARPVRAVIAAHQDDATDHAVLANATFGVALVALGAGVIMLLLDGSAE